MATALRASRWRGEARPERRGLPHRTQGRRQCLSCCDRIPPAAQRRQFSGLRTRSDAAENRLFRARQAHFLAL